MKRSQNKTTTTTRVCTRCKRRKPKATGFYGFRAGKDGLMSHCKACVKERYYQWAADNPEKFKAKQDRGVAAAKARLAAKKAGRK